MQHRFQNILRLGALLGGAAFAAAADLEIQPPRVVDQPVWNYPLQATRESVYEGSARVLISVSEEGQLLDFIVLGFTHPSFAQTVAGTLPHVRFSPGRVRGEPTPTRLPLTFHFQQRGNVVSMTSGEMIERHLALLSNRNSYQDTVCPGPRLDRPLQPATVISPEYPAELRSRREAGEVTVDFYVDADGRVRMPATAPGAHPSFARTAIGAVEQWRFDPPTSAGEPVLVHVQQRFIFSPPPEPKAGAAGGQRTATAAMTEKTPAPPPY